jgi:glutathione S-transferase
MMAGMRPRLYVVPASHPCAAVRRAFELKGIEHDVTELLPGVHAVHQRLRFGRRTVPSLRVDGRKISGSAEIMRWADAVRPPPPLWPSDAVAAAEAWGDEVLQPIGRRLVWFALRSRPDAMPSYLVGSSLPVPAWAARLSGPATAVVEWRLNAVSAEAVSADVAALPGHLARVAALMDEGVIGGSEPNAADLQIASSLALLRTLEDLRPIFAGTPADALVGRWFPDYPGHIPSGALPAPSATHP